MAQTKVFDRVAQNIDQPFTRDEIKERLHNDTEWKAKDYYINACIKDRIRNGKIRKLENGMYEWISNENINIRNIENNIPQPEEIIQGLSRRGGIVELTADNSDIIEDAIRNDPRYPERARDLFLRLKGAIPLYQHDLNGNLNCNDIYYDFTEDEIYQIVRQIKIDNNIVGCSNDQLVLIRNFIMDRKNRFFCKNYRGKLTLVEDLNEFLRQNGNRSEPSLSSKICKFLNDYLYGNDCYFIYDSVVRNNLQRYRAIYGLPFMTDGYYNDYFLALEDLRLNVCPFLSRGKMDHIIWYTNK